MKNILIIFLLIPLLFSSTTDQTSKPDKIAKLLEKAEQYQEKAKEHDQEISAAKKEIRTQKVIAQKIISAYNEATKAKNPAKAKELKPKMDEALAKIEKLEMAIPSNKASIKDYKKEAKFRRKALKLISENSRKSDDYYKLGVAYYKSQKYDKAEANLTLALEDNSKPLNTLQYLMQTAYYMEQEDTTSNEWLAREAGEKVIKTFESKNLEELEAKEKQLLLVAYEVEVFYNFNPTGENDNYNCDDAKPWMDKIQAINPNYARIKPISDYCSQF